MRLFVLLLLFSGSDQLGNIGPYDMVVEELSNCGVEGPSTAPFEIHPYFVKTDDGRKQQLFKGNMAFPFTKEEFYAISVNNTFYMKKNNDFLLIYKHVGNLCAVVSEFSRELYDQFLEKIGAEKGECAIKPGNYSVEGWSPMASLPTPMLEYGTYKVVMRCLLNDEECGCLQAVGVVKPKT